MPVVVIEQFHPKRIVVEKFFTFPKNAEMINTHAHCVQIVSDNNLMEFFHRCEVASAHAIHFLVKRPPAREPIFYLLPATPSRAGLCKAFRKNTASAARKIFQETRKGPGLAQSCGHGTTFAGWNKKADYSSFFPSSCGIRCLSSGSLAMRSISSSIIRTTSALIFE